jgi:hypothetical protein
MEISALSLGCVCLLAAAVQVPAQDSAQEPEFPSANPEITKQALRHYLSYLASDEMQGRMAGSPESVRVSEYLGNALEHLGVQPLESLGGMFQPVPLVRQEFDALPELTLTDAKGQEVQAQYGVEFLMRMSGAPGVRGPFDILHVQKGDELPKDMGLETCLLFHTSAGEQKRMLIAGGHEMGAGLGLVLREASSRPGRELGMPRGRRLSMLKDAEETAAPDITLRGDMGARATEWKRVVFDPHGGDIAVAERNVVGVIPGRGTETNPEVAKEIIVLSAHFDHMGVRSGPTGGDEAQDRILNGADDDASGVATVLELAEALVRGEAPARTVVILLAAAEEMGMLGTHWFVNHCPVDLNKVVCNLNFEMLGRPDEMVGGSGKLWFTGWDRTNLGPLIAETGVGVVADPRPSQRFFMRSDNIVFVQAGIVGQTLSSYNMHKDYHQVSDEVQAIDFDHMLEAGKACLAAVRAVVDGELTPAWVEGEPNLRR